MCVAWIVRTSILGSMLAILASITGFGTGGANPDPSHALTRETHCAVDFGWVWSEHPSLCWRRGIEFTVAEIQL